MRFGEVVGVPVGTIFPDRHALFKDMHYSRQKSTDKLKPEFLADRQKELNLSSSQEDMKTMLTQETRSYTLDTVVAIYALESKSKTRN
jgi:hypothetical protein